jgi:hypothetical protein
MERTKIVGRIGSATAVVMLSVLFVTLGGAPSEAAVCPPTVSICRPEGLVVLAAYDAMAGGAVASSSMLGAAGTGATLAIAAGGAVAVEFWLDTTDPDLQGSGTAGVNAGWDDGINTWTMNGTTFAVTVSTSVGMSQAGPVYIEATWGAGEMTQKSYVFVHSSPDTYMSMVTSQPGLAYQTFNMVSLTSINVGGATWRPVGDPLRYEPPVVNPTDGLVRATVECKDSAGVVSYVTKDIDVPSGTAPKEVKMPAVNCPSGSIVQGSVLDWLPGGVGTPVRLGAVDAPQEVKDLPVDFPDCVTGTCSLSLWQKFATAPSAYCGVLAVGCPEWWTDPNKLDNYECKYGAYPVELGRCAIFRTPGVVKPNTPIRVDPDTGGQISLDTVTTLNPADYVDVDDSWVPKPVPVPQPDPIYDPSNPDPWKPVQPDPYDPYDPEWDPQGDVTVNSGECFPTGWGVFNPVEWVYRPITCALQWAFVPKVAPQMVRTNAAIDGSVVGQIGFEFAAFDDVSWPGSNTSCAPLYEGSPGVFQGVPVTITPCSEIPTAVSGVVRPLLVGLFWLAGVMLAITAVLRSFDIDLMIGRQGGDGK